MMWKRRIKLIVTQLVPPMVIFALFSLLINTPNAAYNFWHEADSTASDPRQDRMGTIRQCDAQGAPRTSGQCTCIGRWNRKRSQGSQRCPNSALARSVSWVAVAIVTKHFRQKDSHVPLRFCLWQNSG